MNTCEGCRHWRALANNGLGVKACYYSQDTGRVRLQSTEECTHYRPGKASVSQFVLSESFRRYEDQRNSLKRLERLRKHLKPDIYRNLRAQIIRFQLYEAARGMDKIERRLGL